MVLLSSFSSLIATAVADTPPILDVQDIHCCFPGASSPAVDHISFQLPRGDLLGILGPSGCGKTTLLRLIAGFENPRGGEIWLAGRQVSGRGVKIPPEQRDIGIVFQDFALFPHLTVAKNITFGLGYLSPQVCRERLAATLALVSLTEYADRFPHELSGGQQQRVALARALAPQPSLILLDEPLSNLDAQVRLYLREEMRKIIKQTGTSAIFVTHDQEEALAIADWVAVMRRGTLEQWGSPETIYHQPATRFVAEFVTQANFVLAHRQGQQWQTEIGLLSLPDGCYFPERSEVMIRQEDLRLEADPQGSLVVTGRQFLGREYRYCVRTPSGQELHALSHLALPMGTAVQANVHFSTPVP